MEVWGFHMPSEVGHDPIEHCVVSLGWPDMGDVFALANSREVFKQRLAETHPETKAGAIPVDAGTLYKFVHEVKPGDAIIYPSKHDRMVNIGIVQNKRWHSQTLTPWAAEFPNHIQVVWKGHFPRSDFSQAALNEIGSFVTLFRVRKNADEFLSKVGLTASSQLAATEVDPPISDDAVAQTTSRLAEENAEDFIIRRIHGGLSGHDFEHFVAHILRCMGYTARVTEKSGDGGVDIIAHTDQLGFEPPIIKVQCKRQITQSGEPEVNQLIGTLGDGEFALFVTLGSYTRQARNLERNKPRVRLLDGDDLVKLVLDNYDQMLPRYRALIPLKRIYVTDLAEEG